MRIAALVTLLVLAVFGAACGGGESESDHVESVIRSYVSHYIDADPEAMYALLDSNSQSLCSQEKFVAFTSQARRALGERKFEIAEIRDLVIEGDRASATVQASVDGESAEPTENKLVKEDGAWRLELPSIGC